MADYGSRGQHQYKNNSTHIAVCIRMLNLDTPAAHTCQV